MATLTSSHLSPFPSLLLFPSSSPTTIIISFTNPTTRNTRNISYHRPPQQRFLCCLAVDRGGAEASAPRPAALLPAELRVALAGGGTGGHIYPAIAIADDLRSVAAGAGASARFLFLGSAAGIESSAVPAAGYDFAPVPPVRLARPLLLRPSNLLLPLHLLRSVASCLRLLRHFRPDVVVGTGGYVAFPVCLAALILTIPIVIQEQNSFPGLTNRLLAPFAVKIFLAFNACVKHFPKEKCFVYGNPVRLALRRFTSKAVARSHFFPKAGADGEAAEVVLVLGGSIGSAAINIAVLNMYYEMLMERKNRYMIWQTGAEGYCEMESLVKNNRRLLLAP